MNDRIESLLLHKPADKLDAAERAEVLAEMSLAEYDRLFHLRSALQHMDAGTAPVPELRARLLAHGRTKGFFQNPATIPPWWRRRVPLWQAAAAMLPVLVAAALVVLNRTPAAQEKTVEKLLVRTDTLVRIDTVWRERVVYRKRPSDQPAPVVLLPDTLPTGSMPQAVAAPAGAPIGDMPALMEFLGNGSK